MFTENRCHETKLPFFDGKITHTPIGGYAIENKLLVISLKTAYNDY